MRRKINSRQLLTKGMVTKPHFASVICHTVSQPHLVPIKWMHKCVGPSMHIRINQKNFPVWVYVVPGHFVFYLRWKTPWDQRLGTCRVEQEHEVQQKLWSDSDEKCHHCRLDLSWEGPHTAWQQTVTIWNFFPNVQTHSIGLCYDPFLNYMITFTCSFLSLFPSRNSKYWRSLELI